jgi:hypothetical protein
VRSLEFDHFVSLTEWRGKERRLFLLYLWLYYSFSSFFTFLLLLETTDIYFLDPLFVVTSFRLSSFVKKIYILSIFNIILSHCFLYGRASNSSLAATPTSSSGFPILFCVPHSSFVVFPSLYSYVTYVHWLSFPFCICFVLPALNPIYFQLRMLVLFFLSFPSVSATVLPTVSLQHIPLSPVLAQILMLRCYLSLFMPQTVLWSRIRIHPDPK